MNKKNKASIIITTYDRSGFFLNRAINSVLNQKTLYTYELIVVDDNGIGTHAQKHTQILLQEYIENKQIKYIAHKENLGACKARNNGVENSNADFIFFLDDDDEFLPNKIQVQLDFMLENNHFDGCLSAFKRYENDSEIIAKSNYPVIGDFVNFSIQGNFFTPMLCIKKESLKKIGGFKEIDRFQDRYLMLHALINGLTFKCINEPLYIMFEHNGDRITNKNKIKTIKSLNKIKGFIENYKNKFSDLEWNDYLTKDQRNRGIVYYVSKKYFIRVKGFKFFFKAFFLKKEMRDLKMMIKCIIKF